MTLDDDVAAILRREADRKGLSFKELVNAALRRGLAPEHDDAVAPRVVTRPHAFGFKAGIDLDKLNQLVDELEAEDFAARQRRAR
ncbi:MAG: DUF2191 domain-containing protein [Verrucomicrobiae bacterium]|nr:DUF2191 domain-containing protein [Verrucomicrobiae bacterium]